jgi:hypothetical protein
LKLNNLGQKIEKNVHFLKNSSFGDFSLNPRLLADKKTDGDAACFGMS